MYFLPIFSVFLFLKHLESFLSCFILLVGRITDFFFCYVKVPQACLTLCNPVDYTVHGILQARILEWVAIPFSRGSSNPGLNLALPHCSKFFTSWATREDHSTGVGSLSFLQGIFLTQELNWDLLYYRWILYQLSYQGSPIWQCGGGHFKINFLFWINFRCTKHLYI